MSFKRVVKLVSGLFIFPLIYLVHLAFIIHEDNSLDSSSCILSEKLSSDLFVFNKIGALVGIQFYVFDLNILNDYVDKNAPHRRSECSESVFSFAVEYKVIERVGQQNILKLFENEGYEVEMFASRKMRSQLTNDLGLNLPVAIVIEKLFTFIFLVVFSREDNTWWFGNFRNDEDCSRKTEKFGLAHECDDTAQQPEFLLNKFHFTGKKYFRSGLWNILIPDNLGGFSEDLQSAKFIECNMSRALLFKKQFGESRSPQALRFKHRAWKILSKAKTVLDSISVPFWLSSGTCLGFFRECDIIPYSQDVDIGVFSSDFREDIIGAMASHGLQLIHRFGLPHDSLELSFIDLGGVKLDIFFFYREKNYIWNGGTQLKSGKKFKYVFPAFNLCWTLFSGLKVRVPCQTEAYISANYGRDWFTPIRKWDWKSSPNNVRPNGFWPKTSEDRV